MQMPSNRFEGTLTPRHGPTRYIYTRGINSNSRKDHSLNIVILTAQIGHYHDARYRGAANAGMLFTVLATQNEADFPEFMASGCDLYPVHRLYPDRAAYTRARKAGTVWNEMTQLLCRLDPSVVAVAGWATPECFAAITWARSNNRRIVMFSESQEHDAARSHIRDYLKKRVVSLCDAALVGCAPHATYISNLGIPPERVFYGYDAVDNAYFAENCSAARIDAGATRVALGMPRRYLLASARFVPKKNLPRLVEAYGKAIEGREGTPDLVILGDGPEREAVEAAILSEGLVNRIHLPGFRGYHDLPALYALSEGFVHVSTSEQWGLVINEAAASGVPIVASTACGATDVLVKDGVNGFVVDACRTESITAGLSHLMDLTEPQRRTMGRKGQDIVADWGPERFARGLIAACEAAAAAPARGMSPVDSVLLRALARHSINAVQ